MLFEFSSEIKQLEGKIKWSVFYFPYSTMEHFGSKGKIPVCITVDGHSFDHMLLPSKNGHFLVYNEFIKRTVGKNLGDSVQVTLERDMKKREIVIPSDIEKMLKDAGVLELFLKQPDYFKREQINHIEISKKDETRINRINTVIKKLREQNA
ncbi:YdeI/OmpD-associated family protein [uncultured Methanocorpusculum sp.]|nr:YdeI/OmpD-associated family protein [uncultured Methanocorpusculum sp.]